MRAPDERDQCQANLDRMVDAFMSDDWPRYREAVALLRDYADQRQIAQAKVMRGCRWYNEKQVEAMRKIPKYLSMPRAASGIGGQT
jgi:hypothetical protein